MFILFRKACNQTIIHCGMGMGYLQPIWISDSQVPTGLVVHLANQNHLPSKFSVR